MFVPNPKGSRNKPLYRWPLIIARKDNDMLDVVYYYVKTNQYGEKLVCPDCFYYDKELDDIADDYFKDFEKEIYNVTWTIQDIIDMDHDVTEVLDNMLIDKGAEFFNEEELEREFELLPPAKELSIFEVTEETPDGYYYDSSLG